MIEKFETTTMDSVLIKFDLYFQPPITTKISKRIIILTIKPTSIWVDFFNPLNHDCYCSATFIIITTNKNNTATAPTYTIKSIIPKNSAPTIIKRQPTEIKSNIKKKTEWIVFLDVITIIAENIAIIEKK